MGRHRVIRLFAVAGRHHPHPRRDRPVITDQPGVDDCYAPSAASEHPCIGDAYFTALATAWNIEELGCPITPGAAAISTAYAPFEGGQMLWRGDTDVIYVLYNDGRWASYPNTWREGDPIFTCGEEDPAITPIRGFGRVWCDYPDVGESLDAVTAAEIGDGASAVQDFTNGTILAAPFDSLFVFVGEDGVWRRVDN